MEQQLQNISRELANIANLIKDQSKYSPILIGFGGVALGFILSFVGQLYIRWRDNKVNTEIQEKIRADSIRHQFATLLPKFKTVKKDIEKQNYPEDFIGILGWNSIETSLIDCRVSMQAIGGLTSYIDQAQETLKKPAGQLNSVELTTEIDQQIKYLETLLGKSQKELLEEITI